MPGGEWYPAGTELWWTIPPSGSLIGVDRTVYRIVSTRDIDPVDWTDAERQNADRNGSPVSVEVVRVVPAPSDRLRRFRVMPKSCRWHVYPGEHWSACGKCGEPAPCRESEREQVMAAELALMERYSTPGVCPACCEPITKHQKSITIGVNVHVPAGPPVTFHANRRACHLVSVDYRRKAGEHPHCTGLATVHADGTYQCDARPACPGPALPHTRMTPCARCGERIDSLQITDSMSLRPAGRCAA